MLLKRFESLEDAATSLAAQVSAALAEAVSVRGAASLLVPGGRTPAAMFRKLRRHPIAWDRVSISLTDERWVPPHHADSNARLVTTEMLAGFAAAAKFIPLYNVAPTSAQGALAAWRALAAMPRPFDVVVLGMGDDGHFASLFPGSPGLEAALDPHAAPACVPMRAPSAPDDRLSLNLAALAASRRLFLFITGERKLELIQSVGSRAWLPIDDLLSLREPGPAIFWAP
ncbi:MAG: 6-phosphogluconolactonase [Gammaproteobacteria bacterium]|nr:6-phosphogluconolactonase [Gammaproteobacteria bacterium]